LGGEMSKTHAEIRNENLERELFNITEEMKQAMEIARIKHIEELPDIEENKKIERNNFRFYNQDQSFFVVITKDKFLDAEHPAVIMFCFIRNRIFHESVITIKEE
jgi:hypothetical protein